jgi:hypothetical protein
MAYDFDEEYKNQLRLKLEKLKGLAEERIKQAGMRYYVPNPVQFRAHQSKARTILICGANRIGKCVTFDTLIDTPNGQISIGELYRNGKPFKVYAWDGNRKVIANASAPFKKAGRHKCYRIEMSDGRWIEAADKHRILMRNGHWAYVDELRSGFLQNYSFVSASQEKTSGFSKHEKSSFYHPQTTWDISRLIHASNDLNFERKEQDCQGGYLEDYRQHDERLHGVLGSVQSFSPSQGGVPLQHFHLSYSDDLGNRYSDSRQRYEHRQPNLDDQGQSEVRFSECLCQTFDTTYLLPGEQRQIPCKQLHGSACQLQSSDEAFVQDSGSLSLSSEAPFLCDGNKIISYHMIGYKEVYDFEVETYHNYFSGGFVNHNSMFGAMELCWHLTKEYPDWFPKERRFKGPIKAVISVDSFDKVMNVIEPKLKALLPKDYYKARRKGGYLSRLECKDGSFVSILTLEMDDAAYESADFDFVWEDEPQDQRKREGLIRGLVDRRGLEVITFTPLTEAWMKDELIDKADGKRIECFFAQMRDNKWDIDGKPILSEESIKEFEESLPEEIKEIRVDGQFFTLRGRVYKEFGEAHTTEFKYQYPDPVTCVLDPHDRLPHHLIWAFIDRNDDVFIDSEMVVHCELDDLARKIKQHEEAHGYKMRKRLIDPNFGLKPAKPGANWSVKDELTKWGTGFYPGNDNLELGHMIVRDYLHYDKKRPLTAVNKPKVFFSKERAPVTVRSMRNLQYDEWASATRMKREPKEETQEKDSHGADTVRYLLVAKPRFRHLVESEVNELSEAIY